MLTIFQVSLFMGIGLTVLSFVFGNIFNAFGIAGLDFNFKVLGVNIVLPINPILYIIMSTVFGGVGWILIDSYSSLNPFIVILIAIIAGIFVSSLIYYIVIKPLKKACNINTPDAVDLVGVRAKVIETIGTGGFGEIRFIINGNSFSSPAKATNGISIRAGKDVAICWIEEHIFYVASIDDR